MDIQHYKYDGHLDQNGYIPQNIDYLSLMKRHIRKHRSYMQPIFEAISNALEVTCGSKDKITVRLRLHKIKLTGKNEFQSLEIEDSGSGFKKDNFERLQILYDESKDCNNLGTGRIQYLHFFDKTDIISIYEENHKKYERRIVLSSNFYSLHKTVIWASEPTEVASSESTCTSLVFFFPLNKLDGEKYSEMSSDSIYNKILIHYLDRFCINRKNLQTIKVETYYDDVQDQAHDRVIDKTAIPSPDYQGKFTLCYQLYDKAKKDFINVENKSEQFRVTSYLLPPMLQPKNQIKLTSKNETVDAEGFDFSFLEDSLKVNNKYMLCLISSNYFTQNDSDERGNLRLMTKADFRQNKDLFDQETPYIFIDSIQENVETKILDHYPEIKDAKKKYDDDLEELIRLFSLNRDIIDKMGYKYGESKASFLKRYKTYDAELSADNDSKISQLFDSLRSLDPSESKFKEKLDYRVSKITSLIPQKNRASVANYIASRKAVLTILELALNKKLEVQSKENKHSKVPKHIEKEKLLHNLLFRQHSGDTFNSNLWILNEDFIHYQGVSECKLRDVEINGEKFLREDLTEAEISKLNAYNHDQLGKRTDILLFPQEHKCIIVELKSTEADVSKFLHQIIDYAGLIRQYAKLKFEITNFYGYLIGENFDFDTVINAEPNFIQSPNLDYVYLPDQSVNGGKYRPKGTLYFEVLKYSSLLDRAKMRNSVFFNKVFKK